MDVDLLSLKWNNHRGTFLNVIGNLRNKAAYTDVTLACGGSFYPVHRIVLSTCSDYFCEIFEQTTCKCPVIVLKDVGCKNLEYLLDYMYIGEVNVKQNELASLVGAAECLRIKGLAVPDEEPVSKQIASNKRQSSNIDYNGSSSPSIKKKKTSRNIIESLDKNCDKEQSYAISDSSKKNSENIGNSVLVEASPLLIKTEPCSDDEVLEEKFVPDSIIKLYTSNSDVSNLSEESTINKSSGLEYVGGNEALEKDLKSDIDLSQPGNSGTIDNDCYQHISDESSSEIQDDTRVNFVQQSEQEELNRCSEDYFITSSETSESIPPSLNACIIGGVEFQEALNQCGIRTYQCTMCSYTSKVTSSCKFHAMTHTGEKPFSCLYCNYTTITTGNLKRHILIHTGEKPYKCQICNYKTTQKGHLKLHFFNKHKIDLKKKK